MKGFAGEYSDVFRAKGSVLKNFAWQSRHSFERSECSASVRDDGDLDLTEAVKSAIVRLLVWKRTRWRMVMYGRYDDVGEEKLAGRRKGFIRGRPNFR